jgi:hypothetical protein
MQIQYGIEDKMSDENHFGMIVENDIAKLKNIGTNFRRSFFLFFAFRLSLDRWWARTVISALSTRQISQLVTANLQLS